MAKFSAMAELVDHEDRLKRNIIDLLLNNPSGAEASLRMLQRVAGARPQDGLAMLRQMARDLEASSPEEVAAKPYRFACEFFFYCRREHIPRSPHWETIPLIDPTKWENFEAVMAQIDGAADGQEAEG